jgi:outer membrane protein OmpA-like peptidoglycan-associated protein
LCAAIVAPLALGACADMGARFSAPAFDRVGPACRDASFPIYFEDGSDQLTEEARAVISSYGFRLRTCHVRASEVAGLELAAAPAGQGGADLVQRRGEAVGRALVEAGLPAPNVEVIAVERGGSPVRPPLRRRAEVILRVGA